MYFPRKVNGPYTRMAEDWDNHPHQGIYRAKPVKVRFKTVRVRATGNASGKDYVAPQR